MESPRLRLLPALAAPRLLLLPARRRPWGVAPATQDAGLQPRALDLYSAVDDASHEEGQGGNSVWGGVLQIEALQEVLKKLKSKRIPVYEKKYGQVPMCDAGEQCAVRKGARIGKLCDCPRGTSCNSFLLKCL
uniref:Cocaine- and amphetamine-regulated transcript protein n=1 Tax=Equus asinus TaxID=9793 RepID=A0A9L0IAE3_EQUAS